MKRTGLFFYILISHCMLLAQEGPYDLVLTGGRVIDPASGFDQIANVAIDGNKVVKITQSDVVGWKEIDCSGLVVSPGFVDVLGDNSTNPSETYSTFEKYKVTDGVTTVLQMHGGAVDHSQYYAKFSQKAHWTNWGVSTKVMILQDRYQNSSRRVREVRKALEAGALGVSVSPEYKPISYNEMFQMAYLAEMYNVPFFIHTRYSSEERELDGVREAIRLAEESGAHVHIDHLHSTGGTYHMQEALQLIEEARDHGARITTCVYPYDYWATYLHSRRFAPGWRARYGLKYTDLTIVGSGERLNQYSFAKYRKQCGVLAAVPSGTMPKSQLLYPALRKSFTIIGSDGGIEKNKCANNHPRGAGTFATAIREGLKAGLSLRDILYKVTAGPAEIIGEKALGSRGHILAGSIADITVFNLSTINGAATVANPNQFSRGIELVVVNGKVAYYEGRLLHKNGESIRN